MVEIVDNIAFKLCTLALASNPEGGNPMEWRLLGQEKDGILLYSWIQSHKTHIGLYSHALNTLEIIYQFDATVTIIQASINSSRTYLGYVLKERSPAEIWYYIPFVVQLHKDGNNLCDLNLKNPHQIMVQFLYKKQSYLTENLSEKFLILIHQECVLQYEIPKSNAFDKNKCESLVKEFSWAQWEPVSQTLYYIHYKKLIKTLIEGEESKVLNSDSSVSTLSALQFHDDLPHETVMNIPLNWNHSNDQNNIYEDDPVPLRIHDCSLDLKVLSNLEGQLYICHHYLCQATTTSENTVHLTFSITALHQSYVLQSVISEIPLEQAKTTRPSFILYGVHHVLAIVPGICTQLLDVGTLHDPIFHITLPNQVISIQPQQFHVTAIQTFKNNIVLNLPTLESVDINLPKPLLIKTFQLLDSLENRLAILHYFLIHLIDMKVVNDLLVYHATTYLSTFPHLLKEFLIGNAFASLYSRRPPNTEKLFHLLPFTAHSSNGSTSIRVNNAKVTMSSDILWNASLMLLSPQQRLVPYRVDNWVKLFDQLIETSKRKQRFQSCIVVEKLTISLVCYQGIELSQCGINLEEKLLQPETLSRTNTPMTPSQPHGGNFSLSDFTIVSHHCNATNMLPFVEMESCTASKQEHIMSVNLRELSMHLLKQTTGNTLASLHTQFQTSMFVNGLATRYVSAQLEASRCLCCALCGAFTAAYLSAQDRGFAYIGTLTFEKRFVLFTLLEKYYYAAESNAFPLPLGFSSFFTYLGYCTLSFRMFLQYLQRNVFELQIDVMKAIMLDTSNLSQKLKLFTFMPRTRAKRLLSQWNHPYSLMIRAREHCFNILSGVESIASRVQVQQNRRGYKLGLAAYPYEGKLSPLDTLLDLLTAKASLNELDFGLLIEATIASSNDGIFTNK